MTGTVNWLSKQITTSGLLNRKRKLFNFKMKKKLVNEKKQESSVADRSKRSLKFIFPRQSSKTGKKYSSRLSPKYLRILRETISSSTNKKISHKPIKPPSILTLKNDKKLNEYSCKECNDIFYFKTSLNDHMARKSWLLAYLDHQINQDDNEKPASHLNNNPNEKNSLKNMIKVRKKKRCVKLFYNKCQFMSYLNKRNITTIDMRFIMLMPLPSELEPEEFHEFNDTCVILMGYLFAKGLHIVEWLASQSINTKWWCNNNNTTSFSKIITNNPSNNNLSFFSDKPLLSLIKKKQSPSTNKLVLLWNSFLNWCDEKNPTFSFDNEIKLAVIMSKLSPIFKKNSHILKSFIFDDCKDKINSDQCNGLLLNVMDQDFIDHWKLMSRPTLNKNNNGQYELLSPKIESDGTAYLIKENISDVKIFKENYKDKCLNELIKKYRTIMFKNLNKNGKIRVQEIINDVKNVSFNFTKTNFVDDELVLSVNLTAMKRFYIYLNDSDIDNFNSMRTDDDFNLKLFENNNDDDDWEYQLETCDACDYCKKIKKPSCYKPGISKPAINEKIYCQCYNFICHLCNLRLGCKSHYDLHKNLHEKLKPFKCPDCKKQYQTLKELEYHFWTKCHHILRQIIYSCRVCNIEGFLTMEELTRHYSHVHTKIIYVCDNCFKIFNSINEFFSHKKIQHNDTTKADKLFICEFGQCIVRPDNYHLHLSNNHPEIGVITYYTCPFCLFLVRHNKDNEKLIENHIFHNHMNQLSQIITKDTLKKLLNFKTKRINSHKKLNVELEKRKMNRIKKKNEKWKIAFNNLRVVNFNCHLCGMMIDTSWSTIKSHFDDKHGENYELFNVYLSLVDLIEENKIKKKLLNEEIKRDNKRKIDGMDDVSSSSSSSSSLSPPKRKRGFNSNNNNNNNNSSEDKKLNSELSNNSQINNFGICIYKSPAIDNTKNDLKCKKCDLILDDVDKFHKHIASNHRIKGNYLICLECGDNFIVEPSLKIHLKAFHGIQDPTVYMTNNKICMSNFNYGDFDSNGSNGNHCHVCMAVFEDNAAVDKHLRVHGMAFLNRKKIQAKQAMDSMTLDN